MFKSTNPTRTTKELINTTQDLILAIRGDMMPSGNLSTGGVARLCGLEVKQLEDHLRDSEDLIFSLDGGPHGPGYKVKDLMAEGFPPKAVWLCVQHFVAESPRAAGIVRTFGGIGLLEILEMFNPSATPTPSPAPSATFKGPSPELLLAQEIYAICKLVEHQPTAQLLVESLLRRNGLELATTPLRHEPFVVVQSL
jgi:hypothetical protein